MIDPCWQLVDLDALTWRQIGRFFEPGQYLRAAQPGEHGLFVLHERGTVLRCVDSQTGVRRDLSLQHIQDPQADARRLYESGQWQRVHVIEKAHLARVAQLAQQMPAHAHTLDQYYHRLYHLLWDDARGYVSVPAHPGHWHGWTYEQIRACLQDLPCSPASLALGVYEHGCWIIGLVLVCARGQIRKITTFEALDAQCVAGGLSAATLTLLARHLADVFAPAAGLLLCTPEVFAAWIEQEAKLEVLLTAQRQHQAYWRWWASGRHAGD
jgi:hypothetical protein